MKRLLLPVLALIAMALPVLFSDSGSAVSVDPRPNVVLIMTDDQTASDFRYMPITQSLIADQGTTFVGTSEHPLCCPARAKTLVGEYAQNNGVHHNGGGWGASNLVDPENNIGRWAQHAGYQTGIVGKFLNGFQNEAAHMPLVGWTDFDISTSCIYCPYGTTFYNNGNPETTQQYNTNYVKDRINDDIRSFAPNGPFLLWAAPMAPHSMKDHNGAKWESPVPQPRDQGTLSDVHPPFVDKPSFNNPGDTPAYLLNGDSHSRAYYTDEFHHRIESLQSEDRMVGSIVSTLSDVGELDNTLIIFEGDNGFQEGEHTLHGKNFPYEESLRVPLVIRGPGVPKGVVSDEVMDLIDVPATIVDETGIVPERTLDGQSMLPVANGTKSGYGEMLIQGGMDNRAWEWRGVRGSKWTYVEHWNGAVELYDRDNDPFEINNLAGNRPVVQDRLAADLDRLKDCSGADCYTPAP